MRVAARALASADVAVLRRPTLALATLPRSLASAMPTCVVYVVDTPRCQSAVTFMSNMLYACSILYKMKLP